MANTKDAPSTFVIWNPARKAEKKDEVFRRHRHAALVHHQRRKERDSQAGPRVSSKILLSKPPLHEHASGITTPTNSSHGSGSTSSYCASPITEPSGRIDPFDALCVQGFPSQALSLLQSAIRDQWPAFASSSNPSSIEQWRKNCMRLAIEAPYLLESITYAGSCYQLFFGSADSSTEFLRIRSHHEAVRHLREALRESAGNVNDAMLMSIAILGVHTASQPPRRRPLSMDPMYRDNDFYSGQPWDQTHINAVLLLTTHRGGLASILIDNLREMIIVIDTQDSLNTLKRPTFALPVSTSTMIEKITSRWPRAIKAKISKRKSGFDFLLDIEGAGELHKLTTRIWAVLESYDMLISQGLRSNMDFHFLVATRRALQHDALSTDWNPNPLYKLCRLAITIYMAESIEPLSAPWPFHNFASKALMLALDECDKLGLGSSEPNFFLWVTVVGAFASRDTSLSDWYIEQLCSDTLMKAGTSWDDMQRISNNFLPLKYRHGQGCHVMWERARSWSSRDHYMLRMKPSIADVTS